MALPFLSTKITITIRKTTLRKERGKVDYLLHLPLQRREIIDANDYI